MSVKTTIVSTATRRLGPLPMFAWVLLLAGSLLVYRHYHRTAADPPSGQFSLPPVGAASAPPAEAAAGASGPGIPELPSSMLAQFLSQQMASIDALTSALTSTPGGSFGDGSPQGAIAQDGPAAGPAPGPSPGSVHGDSGGSYIVGANGEDLLALAASSPAGTPIGSLGHVTPGGGFTLEPLVSSSEPEPVRLAPWEAALAARSQALNEKYGLGDSGNYPITYAGSAMLPPPQTQPAPAQQPALDLYKSDVKIVLTPQGAAGRHVAV